MRGSASTSRGETKIADEVEEPEKDTEKPGYKLARALSEYAKKTAQKYTGSFSANRDYVRGENHWPTPTNQLHMSRDAWKAKTVRNRLFQVIDQTGAMVLDATPAVQAEPIDANVTTEQLELAKNCVQSELRRLRWHEIREDVFNEGAINGKSFAHVYTKKDKLAEAMGIEQVEICAETLDNTRVFPEPGPTRLSQARVLNIEISMPLSRAIEAFPGNEAKLKPRKGQEVAKFAAQDPITRDRSDDELVNGPTGEMIIEPSGAIRSCNVDIMMTWIDQDMIYEETKWRIDQYGNHSAESTDYKRAYPFGRLIVTHGEYLLYDGESPYELVDVFPIAEFTFHSFPDRFWSPGVVAMNKSSQMVADKTMAMALDGARLAMFGNLEYPIGADGYSNKGNAPGESIPTPPELMGMAHYVSPNNVNMQLLSWLDETNRRDFHEQTGISDVLSGAAPVSATSGKELETRARLASTRPGRILKHMNEFDSQFANILFQMMRQNYVGERTFMVPGLNGELEAIRADVSQLPPGIAIRIQADPDEIERDALEGQNVQALVASGMLFQPQMIPLLPMLLPSYSIRPQKAKEIQMAVVNMVATGLIPTDPNTYMIITGQPMPPEMVAQFVAQQQMAMSAATGDRPNKPEGESQAAQ